MASVAETGRLTPRPYTAVVLVILSLAAPSSAQTVLSLEQVGLRNPPDFTPAHAGETVSVRGQVASTAFHFPTYTLLNLQSGSAGAVLQVAPADTRLDGYRPGDQLQVVGKVGANAGMPVIEPLRIASLGRSPPPPPHVSSIAGLQGFQHLGRLVQAEGKIVEAGENTAGEYLLIGSGAAPYKVFLPRAPGQPGISLVGYGIGDTVRVTGVALQYCPRPPYNRWFEMLLHDRADIALVHRSWFVPPEVIAVVTGCLLACSFLIWRRERRHRRRRERQRRIYQLGEELLSAASAEAILHRITTVLPGILGISRARLYVYDRGTKTLEGIAGGDTEPVSIPLASPPGGTPAGAAACFHYRTLLSIPDIARSPFPLTTTDSRGTPKSLLFVPMLSQGEVVGVLELDQDDRARVFTADEQALAQHLGNQIGVGLRLLDQRSVREQLFRSEKLAAVGRLISGVVSDLKAPLGSITELAAIAHNKHHLCAAEREIEAIGVEAQKASQMVARLVSFATDEVETRAVDINDLLRNLIEFRQQDFKAAGIRVRDLTMAEPLPVIGSQGQLEQVFLNLLIQAEQSLATAPEKAVTVRTSLLARRVLIEIEYTAGRGAAHDEAAAALEGLTHSVMAAHGGEVRLVRMPAADPRFEVELPWAAKERSLSQPRPAATPVRAPGRQRTALVIEPDGGNQRQLLGLLSARGFRVVPVDNSDTGLELTQRLRFDLAFCSVHSPGLNWVELSERLQSRVGAFVLLSDGYAPELAADFEGDGRFVLPRPVQEAELDGLIASLEPVTVARVRTA